MTVPAQPEQDVIALPPIVNLTIYAGDDFFMDLYVTNPDGSDSDMTSAVPTAQVRNDPAADPPITSFDITVDSAATNVLHLHLPGDGTAQLPKSAVWDLQIEVPWTTTLVRGDVNVVAEVTRPLPPVDETEPPPELLLEAGG